MSLWTLSVPACSVSNTVKRASLTFLSVLVFGNRITGKCSCEHQTFFSLGCNEKEIKLRCKGTIGDEELHVRFWYLLSAPFASGLGSNPQAAGCVNLVRLYGSFFLVVTAQSVLIFCSFELGTRVLASLLCTHDTAEQVHVQCMLTFLSTCMKNRETATCTGMRITLVGTLPVFLGTKTGYDHIKVEAHVRCLPLKFRKITNFRPVFHKPLALVVCLQAVMPCMVCENRAEVIVILFWISVANFVLQK